MGQIPSFAKLINHGNESRQKIYAGVKVLADLVSSTLGPGGRFVCIHRPMDTPFLTKDGVTVANEVFLYDEFEDAGAQMVKDVSKRTCDQAGDGTTTAAVLAHAMFKRGLDAVKGGANPVLLKKGMDAAVEEAVELIKSFASPVEGEDILKVATISANGDKDMANLVSTAVVKAGRDGHVTLDESHSLETRIKVVDGCHLNTGWISPRFVNDEKSGFCVLENPYILLIDKKLQSISDLLPFLEKISDENRSILFICEDLQGEALATLVFNKARGALNCCAIRTPAYKEVGRELLEDIAALTGATVISDDLGLKLSSISHDHLGQAKTVKVSLTETSILGGVPNVGRLNDRLEEIRAAMDREPDQSQKERLQERLSRLSGGIVVIQIGGASKLEVEEKMFRAEDAMHATRAALEEGIVPGGGVALARASKKFSRYVGIEAKSDFLSGYEIVCEAIKEPLQKIALNAGYNPEETLQKVLAVDDLQYGFNALLGVFGDLKEQGIIDPAKVVLSALRNAESIASLMLVTEGMIVHPINRSAGEVANAQQVPAIAPNQ